MASATPPHPEIRAVHLQVHRFSAVGFQPNGLRQLVLVPKSSGGRPHMGLSPRRLTHHRSVLRRMKLPLAKSRILVSVAARAVALLTAGGPFYRADRTRIALHLNPNPKPHYPLNPKPQNRITALLCAALHKTYRGTETTGNEAALASCTHLERGKESE